MDIYTFRRILETVDNALAAWFHGPLQRARVRCPTVNYQLRGLARFGKQLQEPGLIPLTGHLYPRFRGANASRNNGCSLIKKTPAPEF